MDDKNKIKINPFSMRVWMFRCVGVLPVEGWLMASGPPLIFSRLTLTMKYVGAPAKVTESWCDCDLYW